MPMKPIPAKPPAPKRGAALIQVWEVCEGDEIQFNARQAASRVTRVERVPDARMITLASGACRLLRADDQVVRLDPKPEVEKPAKRWGK